MLWLPLRLKCIVNWCSNLKGLKSGLDTTEWFCCIQVYYSGYEQQWSKDWCSQHTDVSDQNNCIHLTTTTMRTLFFILGFFGKRISTISTISYITLSCVLVSKVWCCCTEELPRSLPVVAPPTIKQFDSNTCTPLSHVMSCMYISQCSLSQVL